jgi:HPt (histidine-containing phosphotransfer) domain-containing protein
MSAIDPAKFTELKQLSGEDLINELIDAFLEEAPGMIQNMQTALTSGDVESFRRNAHSLKSNAYTFGAENLGEMSRGLEMMAKENNLAVGDRIDKLREEFHAVAEELQRLRA